MFRVLIVDDDADVRKFIRVCLIDAGYAVIEAENGLVALQVLRDNKVDLILCDLFMPDQEGLETIRIIRSSGSDVPIIAISGVITKYGNFLPAAKSFGASAVLQKPISVERLLSAVAEFEQPASLI